MCHYTVSRCAQCGQYREVVPSTCGYYGKQGQDLAGYCSMYQTSDGVVDSNGINGVICESLVPFPFIRVCYSDGILHSITNLHQVQELLVLCSSCSPEGNVTPRAADLGGFLFHLVFDTSNIWVSPKRNCLGRYSVDVCTSKSCRKAECVNCKTTGTCGHHGALKVFKPYMDFQPSMFPLLMQHESFLREADLVPLMIRTLHLADPSPSPPPQSFQLPWMIADTSPLNEISLAAQDQMATSEPTWMSKFESWGPLFDLELSPESTV